MEAIIVLLVVSLGLIALDRAALTRGADSREPMRDSHIR